MFSIKFCEKSIFLHFLIYFVPFSLVNSGILEDPLMYEIYRSYIGALEIEEGTVSARRVFSNNRDYEIHIMKLDEVNGKKRHNLLVKESNASNPLIYINNPVETKVSHAYLTFEEFKKELTDRVMVLRQQFFANASQPVNPKSKKENSADKEREVKKFKIFLDRLVNLRDGKDKKTITESTKKHKRKGKSKKSMTGNSPSFRIHTLQTDAEENTNTTEMVKNNFETAREANVTMTMLTSTVEESERKDFTNNVEASIEPPTRSTYTEIPEPQMIENLSEEPRNMSDINFAPVATITVANNPVETTLVETTTIEPTSIETTTTEATTATIVTVKSTTIRPTLGRPLVFLQNDENNEPLDSF